MKYSWAGWSIPAIPELRRLKQESHYFKDSAKREKRVEGRTGQWEMGWGGARKLRNES